MFYLCRQIVLFHDKYKGGDSLELENNDRFALEDCIADASAWLACNGDSLGKSTHRTNRQPVPSVKINRIARRI